MSQAEKQIENAAELGLLRALPGSEFASLRCDEVNLIRASDRRHQKVEESAEQCLQRSEEDDRAPPGSLVPVFRVDVGHAAQVTSLRLHRKKGHVKTRREAVSSNL